MGQKQELLPEGYDMKTSEVINRAADLIEERGWTAGEGWVSEDQPGDRALCLEGGIMAALGVALPAEDDEESRTSALREFWTCPAYVAVFAFLQTDERWCLRAPLLERGTAHAYDWNDVFSRTAEEVIAVLRATALIEAAKENADARESVGASQ